MVTFSDLLTQEQVLRVHEAALEILEQVGMLVRNDKARALPEEARLPARPQ